MLFETKGKKGNPVILFFHAMGVTGESSGRIAEYLQNEYFCIMPTSTVYCEGQKYVSKADELRQIEEFLKKNGVNNLALTAASYFHDITLTIVMTPSDFIWQGFEQGKKDGCREWPVEGESLFSYCGKPLPYMPFCYKHPEYWQVVKSESKKSGNMIDSKKIFDDSEAAHPITEDEFIKIENIKGKLLMIGAEDDCLWNAAKYVKRAEKRLSEKTHDCDAEFVTYKHGSHFVFPESLFKTIFPIGANILFKVMFKAAKEFPKECKETRIDIDKRLSKAIKEWINK